MADGRSLERFLDPAFDIAQDEGLQQACREMSAGGRMDPALAQAMSQRALMIQVELNGSYHDPEEVARIFSWLIGEKVPEGFCLFPPFYTGFGANIHLGKDVFINSGCHFQSQGGIWIGDGTLIGHDVVLATLNHAMAPARRAECLPEPIHIGKNVWIGSKAVVLPGVTIGDAAVIAAGAVVAQDVSPCTVAAGVPARPIREISEDGTTSRIASGRGR